jgi:hypothetical protein
MTHPTFPEAVEVITKLIRYFCSEFPCGGEDSFGAAAKALIRSFLAKRLLRCVSFTRPL